MATDLPAVRGMMRGPFVIPAPTPIRLWCPDRRAFENAIVVDVSAYEGFTQVMWQCYGCTDPNAGIAAVHCAILPAVNYISPEARP